jgi:hypothetical protein
MVKRLGTAPEDVRGKVARMVGGPFGPLMSDVLQSHIDTYKKGVRAAETGHPVQAQLYGAATAVPGLGPAIANMAETAFGAEGKPADPGRAAGQVLGNVMVGGMLEGTPELTMAGKGAVRTTTRAAGNAMKFKSQLNPIETKAIEFLRERGVPLTPGTITGNRYLRANEAVVKHSPLGAQTAHDFNLGTTAGVKRVAGELSSEISPVEATPESAGQAITGKLQKNIKDLGLVEDEAYQDAWIGRGEDAYSERVPVRMGKQPELDNEGLPTGKMVDAPVYEKVNMPVDVRDLKVQAQPIFDEMQWMPASEQASSAGYAALKKLLSGDDFIPAWQAEKGLSGLKSMARVTSKSGVRDTAQGIAAGLIPDLQRSIDAAVAKTGPNSIKGLMKGRATHASMMEVADLADQLRAEPVQTFNQMSWEKDTGIAFLRKIKEQAPEQMPLIARAWVQQQFEKAAQEGGFTKTTGILSKWRNLGPETQKLFFPDPTLRENLSNLFKGADMVQFNPNTSGTELTRQATSTNPLRWAAGYVGSKAFYTPAGIRLLTEKLRPYYGPPPAPRPPITTFHNPNP